MMRLSRKWSLTPPLQIWTISMLIIFSLRVKINLTKKWLRGWLTKKPGTTSSRHLIGSEFLTSTIKTTWWRIWVNSSCSSRSRWRICARAFRKIPSFSARSSLSPAKNPKMWFLSSRPFCHQCCSRLFTTKCSFRRRPKTRWPTRWKIVNSMRPWPSW